MLGPEKHLEDYFVLILIYYYQIAHFEPLNFVLLDSLADLNLSHSPICFPRHQFDLIRAPFLAPSYYLEPAPEIFFTPTPFEFSPIPSSSSILILT
jgi:hypothetical protein